MSDKDEATYLRECLDSYAKQLKKQHLDIAKALALGKTAEEAYAMSGGKGKNGKTIVSRLLSTNVNLSQYVETARRIASLESQSLMVGTYEQKRKMLWEAAQRCMQEIEPEYDGHGEDRELVGFKFDASGMTRAIQELNKMDGDYKPIQTENTHLHKFETLTDVELNDRISQLLGKAGTSSAP